MKQKQGLFKASPARAPLVLTLICLIVTGLLVCTYQFTKPLIDAAKQEAADAARREVMPTASEFASLPLPPADNGGPGQVREIYQGLAEGQTVGWVFTCSAKGYGSQVIVMCGIDTTGQLTKVKITEHGETPGLGSKVATSSYTDQYSGLTLEAAEELDGVSGATLTSTALKNALAAAKAAYEAIATSSTDTTSETVLETVSETVSETEGI